MWAEGEQDGPRIYGPSLPTAASGRRRGLAAFTLFVVLVAALGSVVYFLFVREEVAPAGDPRSVVRQLYASLESGDCKGAAAMLDRSAGVSESELCGRIDEARRERGTLRAITAVGDEPGGTAVVAITVEREDREERLLIRAHRGGAAGWRVGETGVCLPALRPEDRGGRHLAAGATPPPGAYSSNPPTSGVHAERPADTGKIYEINPGVPELVHAMEHGAVVVWHSGLAPDERTAVEDAVNEIFAAGYPSLVVTPHQGMTTPIAVTAWGALLECAGVDAEALLAFVDTFYASGPEGSFACDESRAAGARPPACRRRASA